jgi:hypothetical protein
VMGGRDECGRRRREGRSGIEGQGQRRRVICRIEDE